MAAERVTVIGSKNNDRIVRQPIGFQRLQHPTEHIVYPGNCTIIERRQRPNIEIDRQFERMRFKIMIIHIIPEIDFNQSSDAGSRPSGATLGLKGISSGAYILRCFSGMSPSGICGGIML